MRDPGLPPSRLKPLGPDRADRSGQRARLKGAGLLLVALAVVCAKLASAQGLSEPLTDTAGDPVRGEQIVTDPQHGLCTLCHSGPFPQVAFSGTLGPDLTGIGARRDIASLRQQIVDSRVANPDTIMPPYYTTDGLFRVGARWQGSTLLTAQEVEDVVAYLATLTGAMP
jgi:L-cysteine S-thiosulfotransferase